MRRIISALLLLALLLTGCGGVSKEEYESGTLLNPEVAFSMYPSLYISNFRPAEESDWGLDSVHLAYEACET